MKTIIFDLGGVLLHVDPQKAVRNFLKQYPDIDLDLFNERLFKSDLKRSYEMGLITSDQFFQEFMKGIDRQVDFSIFKNCWQNMFHPNNFMLDVLQKFKMSYRLFLLSNTNDMHIEYILKNYPFMSLFEKKYFSHEMGILKPEKDIYFSVLELNLLSPSQTLFIDDDLANIEAANNCGMHVIHYQNNDKFLVDVEESSFFK